MNAKEYLKSKGWMYDHIGNSVVDGTSVIDLMEEYAEMKIKNHSDLSDVSVCGDCEGVGYLWNTKDNKQYRCSTCNS